MSEKQCPFCGSKDYEYYINRNHIKRTDWMEHRCLKCKRKWGYIKGEVREIE